MVRARMDDACAVCSVHTIQNRDLAVGSHARTVLYLLSNMPLDTVGIADGRI